MVIAEHAAPELDRSAGWRSGLDALHARVAPRFRRSEGRARVGR
jgi:hypothetical protein